MKVLRILPELDFGGVESRLEVQARMHDPRAYELAACCFHRPGKAAAALRALGVPVEVLDVDPSPRNPAATLALARYLRRLRPDIVHASIAEANLHALVAGRLASVPVLIAEETGMPRHSRIARLTYRVVYRFADAVVGVSNAVCDYVRDVDRAPRDRVRRIYNCANPRYFPEIPPSVSREADGALDVLLVGRLVPVKNHLFFFRVLREVLPKHPRVRVRIAGDGPLREQLQTAIDADGLASRIELLGLRADVDDLLHTAHIFALPSVSEGCSVSLIEAMASGVHVIGSDVAGIREVMGSLAAEWTAAPSAEAEWSALLHRAFELAPVARERLAEHAQRRVYENFSPSVYVRTLEHMYRELGAHRRQ